MKIYSLFDIPEEELPRVGGKARGLYILHKAGLGIAEGYVLSDADLSSADEACEWFDGSGLVNVAVRSSAESEDGKDLSGAGQYETALGVTKETFRDAFLSCVSSLGGDRAIKYSSAFGKTDCGRMNVVVQTMVNATVAGVGFSTDPTGEKDCALIEAVRGLGESLVSGTSKSTRYSLKRNGAEFVGDGVLSASLQSALLDGLLKAETALGTGADCEWAAEGDRLYWLQARPITTDDVPDEDELNCGRDLSGRVITSCNVGEMLPGAITPLSLSTTIYALDYGIRNMLALAGVIKSPDSIPPQSCILSVKNHLFIDMTTLYSISKNVMMASKKSIDLAICGRELDYGDTAEKAASPFRKLRNGIRYFKILTGAEKSKKKLVAASEKFKFSACVTAADVYAEIDNALPAMYEAMWYHYNTSSHSGAMNGALNMVLKDKISDPEEIKAKVAGTLEGIDDIESVAILADLRKIAEAVLADRPDARDFGKDELAAYLDGATGETRAAIDAFLSRHGHRAIREAELRSKSWRDDKEAFYGYIRTVLSSDGREKERPADWEKNTEELAAPFNRIARKAIRFLVKQCRKGVVNREFSKSYIIKIIDAFKKRYRLLATRLVEDGLLPDEDCIYFLTHEEIGRLIRGEGAGLVKKCIARRRLLPVQNAYVFPDVSCGAPQPIVYESTGGDEYKGDPVSRGSAVGRARIVKSAEDAKKIENGEIMVSCYTDIGWSPYYCLLSGLITEVGSALSHGAVVAREYALPLVVNVPFATECIKNGDLISLDACTGDIRVLERAGQTAAE